MLTGLYPHNHGLTENEGRFGGRAGLDASDTLIHEPFRAAGYRCGWFGKWHLSNDFGADAFGFEGYGPAGYGYPYGSNTYAAYLARHSLPAPLAEIELPGESGTPAGRKIDLTRQKDWFDYEAGAALLRGPAEAHEAFFVADLARDWLLGLGDTPFFCRVDTWGPHPPYLVGGQFVEMFEDLGTLTSPNLGSDLSGRPLHHAVYRDYWRETLVEGADDFPRLCRRALQQAALCETALSSLLDTVEALGQRDNTIIVFSADHGDAVGSNGGVCNKGGLMVEETLRIPLCIAGPGIRQGADDTLVCNIDIAPTLCDLAGVTLPGTDGQSLRPRLEQSGPLVRDGVMTQHFGLATPQPQRAFHADRWKLVVQADGFAELYDLHCDPAEMVNRAQDPACAGRLEQMIGGLARAMAASGDTTFPLERLA